MKNISALLIPATLMIGAAMAQPGVAQAAPAAPAGNATVAVNHADLNLANEADRNTLQRRLIAAVREVCGTGYSFDLRSRIDARDCQEETLQSIAIPMPGVFAAAE